MEELEDTVQDYRVCNLPLACSPELTRLSFLMSFSLSLSCVLYIGIVSGLGQP